MSESNIVVINRGTRRFDLKAGPKGEKRTLMPGGSIETLDADEAKQLLGYFHEIGDASKIVPANAAKIKSMQAEIDRLTADNEKKSKIIGEPKKESKDEEKEEHTKAKKGR